MIKNTNCTNWRRDAEKPLNRFLFTPGRVLESGASWNSRAASSFIDSMIRRAVSSISWRTLQRCTVSVTLNCGYVKQKPEWCFCAPYLRQTHWRTNTTHSFPDTVAHLHALQKDTRRDNMGWLTFPTCLRSCAPCLILLRIKFRSFHLGNMK